MVRSLDVAGDGLPELGAARLARVVARLAGNRVLFVLLPVSAALSGFNVLRVDVVALADLLTTRLVLDHLSALRSQVLLGRMNPLVVLAGYGSPGVGRWIGGVDHATIDHLRVVETLT